MELARSDEVVYQEVGNDFRSTEVELDLPPEYCHYRDDGCELANSCLNCPFVRCIYDEPRGKQRWLKRMRAREMARLFTRGRKIKELAQMFGVSQRTVQRALKEKSEIRNNTK